MIGVAVRRLLVLGVCALVLTIAQRSETDAGFYEPPYNVRDITVSPTELRCDGDSARLSGRVRNLDGTPAAHVPVAIAIWDGSVTIRGQTSEHIGRTETNALGFIQAWLTPAPGTSVQFRYLVFPGDRNDAEIIENNPFARKALACPLEGTGDLTLTGHVWYDDDADGTANAEHDVAHAAMTLVAADGGGRGNWADRTTYTDGRGEFGWHGFGSSPAVGSLCVDPGRLRIVTVNGEPFGSNERCLEFAYGPYDPFGHYEIGVQRQ